MFWIEKFFDNVISVVNDSDEISGTDYRNKIFREDTRKGSDLFFGEDDLTKSVTQFAFAFCKTNLELPSAGTKYFWAVPFTDFDLGYVRSAETIARLSGRSHQEASISLEQR